MPAGTVSESEPVVPECPESDRALVARLQAGDEAAFDLIYDRYRPRVFGFLFRLSRDRALAEDLVQETFLRLARKAHSLLDDTNPRAWLFTVARNLFVSHRRWRLLDLSRLAELSRGRQEDPPLGPGARLEALQTGAQLDRAIARLALDQREALLLVAVEGMTPSEAALVAKVSPETLRQRLTRARRSLEKELE